MAATGYYEICSRISGMGKNRKK